MTVWTVKTFELTDHYYSDRNRTCLPIGAGETDSARSCRFSVVVLVARIDAGFDHLLLKNATELVVTDTSHESCRVRHTNQPLRRTMIGM